MKAWKLLSVVSMFAVSTSAFAVPSGFKLVKPDSMKLDRAKKEFVITFTAPCSSLDWETVVFSYDDSGDQELAVGIVVPTDSRSCTKGPKTQITRTYGPMNEEYKMALEAFELSPMKLAR